LNIIIHDKPILWFFLWYYAILSFVKWTRVSSKCCTHIALFYFIILHPNTLYNGDYICIIHSKHTYKWCIYNFILFEMYNTIIIILYYNKGRYLLVTTHIVALYCLFYTSIWTICSFLKIIVYCLVIIVNKNIMLYLPIHHQIITYIMYDYIYWIINFVILHRYLQ